jgi:hypothetical protein
VETENMAATSAPYGFQPIDHLSGIPRPIRMPFGIASGQAGNIFKYQPIRLTAGLIVGVTSASDPIWGIFQGVEFTPTGGRPAVSPFWPDGQTYDSTFNMFVYFWPGWDPALRVKAQANGSIAQALMGAQFDVVNFAAGNTATGLSSAQLSASSVGNGTQGQFFLQEFGVDVGDQLGGGDAFTDCILGIARPQVGGAPQTSIA